MSSIEIWEFDTPERNRLENLKNLIEEKTNVKCYVGETYFDFGQDWSWTTIISLKPDNYQMLNPAQHEKIIFGTEEQFQNICNELINKINERGW